MRPLNLETGIMATIATLFMVISSNMRSYRKAREWIYSHEVTDCSQYEDRLKKKNDSIFSLMYYHLGRPGRKLAYRVHAAKKVK